MYVFAILCCCFALLEYVDLMGIHNIIKVFQQIVLIINIHYMLLIAFIVFISVQFALIISRFTKNVKIEFFAKILGVCIVLVCWGLNIETSVQVFNWKRNAFSTNTSNIFNFIICLSCFLFLITGSSILLHTMNKISKVQSDLENKKRKRYKLLSITILFFALGNAIYVFITSTFLYPNFFNNERKASVIIFLAPFGSLLMYSSSLFLFVDKKKKKKTNSSSIKTEMKENSIKLSETINRNTND